MNLLPKKDPILFSLQPLHNRGMFEAIRGMMRNNRAYVLLKLTPISRMNNGRNEPHPHRAWEEDPA